MGSFKKNFLMVRLVYRLCRMCYSTVLILFESPFRFAKAPVFLRLQGAVGSFS